MKLKLILSVPLALLLSTEMYPNPQQQILQAEASQNSSFIKKYVVDGMLTGDNLVIAKFVVAGALMGICWHTASDNIKKVLRPQLTPQGLAVNLAYQFGSWFGAHALATTAHEFGHALTSQILTGIPSTIYLGSTHAAPSLASFKNVHLNGFNPTLGCTQYNFAMLGTKQINNLLYEYCKNQHVNQQGLTVPQLESIAQSEAFQNYFFSQVPGTKKYAAILMAGGISGALIHCITQAIITKKVRLDVITLHHLVHAFIPVSPDSDAARLWRRCFNIEEQKINSVIEWAAPLVEVTKVSLIALTEALRILDENKQSSPPDLHTFACLVTINTLLYGYLRFSVS